MNQNPLGIIITMAGSGERFRREGYKLPKYMIEVKGQTLFQWAMQSLANFVDENTHMVFLARREHQPENFILEQTRLLGIENVAVHLIDTPTDGQATSAQLAGAHLANPDGPCLIYNIDTHVEPRVLRPQGVRGDGWIPCFPGEGSGWSFADVDSTGRVSRVVEKVRISPHATVGLYWFRSFRLFEDLYHRHFAMYGMEAGEKYIAPMYNTLIAAGGEVYYEPLLGETVHALGTPAEVQTFIESDYRASGTC